MPQKIKPFGLGFIFFFFASMAHGDPTLYEKLGGKQGIEAIVSDFVDMTVQDPRVMLNSSAKTFLDHCSPGDIKNKLSMIICEAAGGPCKSSYARASVEKSVKQMHLMGGDRDAVKADFSAALAKFKVSAGDQTKLYEILQGD